MSKTDDLNRGCIDDVPGGALRRGLAAILVILASGASSAGAEQTRGDVTDIAARAEAERVAVVERVSPSVVCMYDAQKKGGGSGVIIDRDGYGLTNYHVDPTCSPTRSALLTGRYSSRTGVWHTIMGRSLMHPDETTIAEIFAAANYQTGIFGKWHLGDEEPYQPHNRGFDEVFIHGAGGIGQAYPGSCADAPPNQKNRYFDPVIRHNTVFVKTMGFCTDVFFRQALGWIKQQKDKDGPFFAFISTNAPHGPMIAPEEYKRPFVEAGFDENTAARYGMITMPGCGLKSSGRFGDSWSLNPT